MQQKQKKYTLIKASVVYENYVNLHGLGLDLLKMGEGGSCKMAFSSGFEIIFVLENPCTGFMSHGIKQRLGPLWTRD
jgi:hypothetical protein